VKVTDNLKAELSAGIRQLDMQCTDEKLDQLLAYLQLLIKWNGSFNLSGITVEQEMVSKHLLDSLALGPYLHGVTLVDIGSGAGLPGIPLAVLYPDKHFTLVDSNGKKTSFLFQVKLTLGLENVAIENSRIEHFQSNRQIDMVMCRAFSSLEDVVNKSQQFFDYDCKLLAMKGHYPQEEINSLPPGYIVTKVVKLEIPGSESQRHLVEVMREKD
jgi:16S rRNA (guanine527-N7)-methyltransferase